MAKIRALLAVAVILALCASLAGAQKNSQEYHLKLLAVSEELDKGLTADLFVTVAPGSGNVFIETDPATKLDTRISTKLAKEIACESLPQVTAKCDKTDFFFRIEANASLIGGPSAGAAAAVLAIAAADNASIDQSVAVTGTINSGGLIGEVGGLKEKVDAAASYGLNTVLIPLGERHLKASNQTEAVDLVAYGRSRGVRVIEVGDLKEALLYITGRNYSAEHQDIEIDKSYSEIMNELASELCQRSHELASRLEGKNLSAIPRERLPYDDGFDVASRILDSARNLTRDGLAEQQSRNYYSAASFCFGANVRYGYLSLLESNLTGDAAMRQLNSTLDEIEMFEEGIPEAGTLSTLQVRGTVKERIDEARQLLSESALDLERGMESDGLYKLAFARERLGSAGSWNRFLVSSGARSSSPASLREGCMVRIQEAEEHIHYLELFVPGLLKSTEMSPSYTYMREGDYSACIFRASLSKAKANAMLSALGSGSGLTGTVQRKLAAARESIVRQTGRGEFPLVSYSYYEYAGTLSITDQPSALLFAEYALELSNLQIYLKTDEPGLSPEKQGQGSVAPLSFFAAILIGFAVGATTALAAILAKRALGRKRQVVVLNRKLPRKKPIRQA